MTRYTYVWEYIVHPTRVPEFRRIYGPKGEWVRLFRKAPGYVRTELLRDRANPCRFMTIDHWESLGAWEKFRAEFAEEFEDMDAKCARMTQKETGLGRFEAME